MVAGGAWFGTGGEVEPGAAPREQVDRRGGAGERIGIGVTGVGGRDEPDVLGEAREVGDRRHRVGPCHQVRVAELEIVAGRQPVAEEEVVEPGRLGDSGRVPQHGGVATRVAVRARVPPPRGVGADGPDHRADDESRHCVDLPTPTLRSSGRMRAGRRHTRQPGVTDRHRPRDIERRGSEPRSVQMLARSSDERALERVALAEPDPVDVADHDPVRLPQARLRVRHAVVAAVRPR